jgi:hypothetical protein
VLEQHEEQESIHSEASTESANFAGYTEGYTQYALLRTLRYGLTEEEVKNSVEAKAVPLAAKRSKNAKPEQVERIIAKAYADTVIGELRPVLSRMTTPPLFSRTSILNKSLQAVMTAAAIAGGIALGSAATRHMARKQAAETTDTETLTNSGSPFDEVQDFQASARPSKRKMEAVG